MKVIVIVIAQEGGTLLSSILQHRLSNAAGMHVNNDDWLARLVDKVGEQRWHLLPEAVDEEALVGWLDTGEDVEARNCVRLRGRGHLAELRARQAQHARYPRCTLV